MLDRSVTDTNDRLYMLAVAESDKRLNLPHICANQQLHAGTGRRPGSYGDRSCSLSQVQKAESLQQSFRPTIASRQLCHNQLTAIRLDNIHRPDQHVFSKGQNSTSPHHRLVPNGPLGSKRRHLWHDESDGLRRNSGNSHHLNNLARSSLCLFHCGSKLRRRDNIAHIDCNGSKEGRWYILDVWRGDGDGGRLDLHEVWGP